MLVEFRPRCEFVRGDGGNVEPTLEGIRRGTVASGMQITGDGLSSDAAEVARSDGTGAIPSRVRVATAITRLMRLRMLVSSPFEVEERVELICEQSEIKPYATFRRV